LFDDHLRILRRGIVAKSMEELLAKRPVDRAAVNAHEKRTVDEVRAYRLRELREALELRQAEPAGRLHVSQNRVSRTEHGGIDRARSIPCENTSRRSAAGYVSRLSSATNESRLPDAAIRSGPRGQPSCPYSEV
jgi:hypothetical protein